MNAELSEYTAPEGHEWVCVACGRHGSQRARIGDESCFLNAELFEKSRLIYNADGRLVREVTDGKLVRE